MHEIGNEVQWIIKKFIMDNINLSNLLTSTRELGLSTSAAVKLLLTQLEKRELEEIRELSSILILSKGSHNKPQRVPLETVMNMSLDEIKRVRPSSRMTKRPRRNYRGKPKVTVEQLDKELEEYMNAAPMLSQA